MAVNGGPFNNPGAQPALVEMWRNNLRKSHQKLPEPPMLPSVIIFNFDGGGLALTAGLAGLVEVTFPCRILSCHLYAGIVVAGIPQPTAATASVELRLGAQGSWPSGSSPIYGSTRPSMTSTSEADVSIADWTIDLQPGDVLPYSLYSFSGSATFLTLSLPVRRVDVLGVGLTPLFDSTSDALVDSAGNRVVNR